MVGINDDTHLDPLLFTEEIIKTTIPSANGFVTNQKKYFFLLCNKQT